MSEKTDMFGEDNNLDPEEVLKHLDVELPKRRWDGMLNRMIDAVSAALGKTRLTPDEVSRLTPSIVIGILDQVGGNICYFPRGVVLRAALRDRKIFEDWSVHNVKVPELANRNKLAVQTVYEIIKRQRMLARHKEPDLFGFDKGVAE